VSLFKRLRVLRREYAEGAYAPVGMKWAVDAKHPWLTVLNPQARASGLQRFDAGTPSYILIDASGKILESTEKGCMKRIKKLTGM